LAILGSQVRINLPVLSPKDGHTNALTIDGFRNLWIRDDTSDGGLYHIFAKSGIHVRIRFQMGRDLVGSRFRDAGLGGLQRGIGSFKFILDLLPRQSSLSAQICSEHSRGPTATKGNTSKMRTAQSFGRDTCRSLYAGMLERRGFGINESLLGINEKRGRLTWPRMGELWAGQLAALTHGITRQNFPSIYLRQFERVLWQS
jgi:hypothetical protein